MEFEMRSATFGVYLFIAIFAGCTAPGDHSTIASTQPHAECLVCKKNADLACIDVAVDPTTPSYPYNGKTYYFCSQECRDKFARDPARYLPK
jgi:Cu+-exporting ATPase